VNLYLPKLRPDQSRIARNQASQIVLSCGRRWGKSVLGGTIGAACANRGGKVAWIAPNYRNSRPLWRWLEAATAMLRKAKVIDVSRSERVITFPSGGFIGVYSGDNPDSVRGESFHLVVVDEAARIPEDAYQEAIEPTLADYGGKALLISTPMGKNWFWREFNKGLDPLEPYVYSYTASSVDNPNPRIQRAYWLAKERRPERVWRQEWCAEFLDEAGVFQHVYASATLSPLEQGTPGRTYVMGADWAGNSGMGDFTCFVVFDAQTREMVAVDRFHGTSFRQQRDRLLALHKRFSCEAIVAETNSFGAAIIEDLRDEWDLPIVGWVTTQASKKLAVERFQFALEHSQVHLLNDPILTHELSAYEVVPSRTGIPSYRAPEGGHDDTVIATLLAYMGSINYGESGIAA
jgi:phage terminase large subunit-like protein